MNACIFKRRALVYVILGAIFSSSLFFPGGVSGAESPKAPEDVRIGVLVTRGAEIYRDKWEPTAGYLTEEIPGYYFTIVPLGFDEYKSAVKRDEVDFIMLGSSFYAGLQMEFGVNRIATLKNRCTAGVFTVLGGVIFSRAGRGGIRSLEDLKGKTFMGVDELSLGGWLAQWQEMKEVGIDPRRDLAKVTFGGTQDAVVYAVRDGKVDVGAVRTDTLERMAAKGQIRLKDFHILELDHIGEPVCEFPFLHSTNTYPEWPIAELEHTANELAEKVAIALISMPAECPAAMAAHCAGWTVPLNYQPVHDLLKELGTGPYEDYGKVTLIQALRQHWFAETLLLGFALVSIFFGVYASRSKRRIQASAEALKSSEQKLRGIVENSTNLFYSHTPDHILTYLSPQSREFFGRAPEEAMKRWTTLATDNPINERGLEITQRAIDTGERQPPYELELFGREGRKTRVEVNEAPIVRGGKTVAIVGSLTDITEQKRAEEALRENRERLELAMDAGEHGFWDWNLDTNDVYFSPRYYTMLSYEPGELPMRLETWVNLMHPEDREKIVPLVQEYVKNSQPYEVEFRLRTRDGGWCWISGRGKSFKKDDRGNPHRALGVHVDITERKQAEEKLQEYRDHLEELVEERTRELKGRVDELERFHDAAVDRELRIKELREEVDNLKKNTDTYR
ncbi:MAG: PhnD/SsuA/transferrin family substrate-binding protein [Candidatus Auribacterota bacterium]|nr:PhnD/SsuA/transferrin family substrate-binding protein [Candidatus Auribacterota bacterium]